MAFRSGKRKDVKKQSYYVWFLGAKESKGLRGEEYIRPVLRHLVDKERELEPMKVTLQVSTKGIKIIQNVPRKNHKGGNKTEQIKHFIPHHAITCVMQESKPNDDVVCCILLIYNPLTKCPVHVHAYRCDSVETASTLRTQLQILIDRPENQKKFREIENRLAAKGLLPSRCLNSDGRSTRTDGSDRTEDSSGGSSEREVGVRKDHIASLYDSLAAELRERLNNPNSCPILLPPKDYDTVTRRHGKFNGIDNRRSTNYNLVGANSKATPKNESSSAKSTTGKSSGKSSSGIGSDEALSSAIQEVSSHPDFESKEIDPDTSSDEGEDDEDWPEPEALAEDDEVVPYEWRRIPPTPQHYKTRSTSPAAHPPPLMISGSRSNNAHQPQVAYRDRRSRSSPDDDDDPRFSRHVRGIVDKFERRAASPPDMRPHKAVIGSVGKTAGVNPSDPYDRYNDYRDVPRKRNSPPPSRENEQRVRNPEVVYRRHSSPLERKGSRETRPLSYPAAGEAVSPHATKRQGYPERNPEVVDHLPTRYGAYDRYERHLPPPGVRERDQSSPEYYRDSRRSPPVMGPGRGPHLFRSPERHSPPAEMYPPQRLISDPRLERSLPTRYAEPFPINRQSYHPPATEERRKSGYFDLPVDPRDYRHSFVESPYRRLPLNSQY